MERRAYYWPRSLRLSDWVWCFNLAAEPGTREHSLDPRPPTLLGHARWMWRQLRRAGGRRAWVIERHRPGDAVVRVALVRAEPCGPRAAEIGIAVVPEFRGMGIGTGQIADMTPTIWRTVAQRGIVFARIKVENEGSIKAFERAGYVRTVLTPWPHAKGLMAMKWWDRHKEV